MGFRLVMVVGSGSKNPCLGYCSIHCRKFLMDGGSKLLCSRQDLAYTTSTCFCRILHLFEQALSLRAAAAERSGDWEAACPGSVFIKRLKVFRVLQVLLFIFFYHVTSSITLYCIFCFVYICPVVGIGPSPAKPRMRNARSNYWR